MSMPKTFFELYRKYWSDWLSSWDALIGTDPDAATWNQPFRIPDGCVNKWLGFGLDCAYGGDRARAVTFFRRCVHRADGVIEENRFHDTTVSTAEFPASLGRTLRDRAYAKWLLGELLDRDALAVAARAQVEWCLTKANDADGFSSPVTMNRYLEGVRCALIAGDVEYARECVGIRRRFKWHHAQERELWQQVLDAHPVPGDRLTQEVEGFFDRVRDPTFTEFNEGTQVYITRETLRFDTAIIRQQFLINPDFTSQFDPYEVVESVCR